MLIKKSFSIGSISFLLFALLLSNTAFSQNDDVEIEVPIVKNTLGVRPLAAIFGFYGLSYERYLVKGFSAYAYAEISDGPRLFSKNVNSWTRNSMDVENATLNYSGYGGAIGVRKYFADKTNSLVGDKDMGSLLGWFVGAYIPWRHMKISVNTVSYEQVPGILYPAVSSEGHGSYTFKGDIYGLGFEGGRHWCWDKFSFEMNVGFAYMQGLPSKGTFDYTYPIFGQYKVDKKLGLVGFYGTFAPKFEIVMGFAF